MSVKNVKVEKVKAEDVIYKDGRTYTIVSVMYDGAKNRYLVTGTGGYYASVPKGRTLPIQK